MTERKPPAAAQAEAPAEVPTEPAAAVPAAAQVATVDQPTAAYPLVVEREPEPASAVPALAGEVAMEVARQLTDPVRALRDRLGLVVDHLERHVATSTGPTPHSRWSRWRFCSWSSGGSATGATEVPLPQLLHPSQ